jgi:hypothetical protein
MPSAVTIMVAHMLYAAVLFVPFFTKYIELVIYGINIYT